MKFKNIYKVAGIIGLYLLMQSRSGGPATQANLRVTGAPGEGTCANPTCHTAGSFGPAVTMLLLDGTNAVTKYDPGKTYTLQITNIPASGTPARYGFQSVSLDAANTQAGKWGTNPVGMTQRTLAGRIYIEHSAPAATGVFEMPWEAPAAAGAGSVTFYASSIASNNNGQTNGDGFAGNSLAIEENATSSIDPTKEQRANLEVLPNPVAELLNLRMTAREAGAHEIRIFSAQGTQVKLLHVMLQVGENLEQVSVGDLPSGLYLVQLNGDGHLAAVQMLKQ